MPPTLRSAARKQHTRASTHDDNGGDDDGGGEHDDNTGETDGSDPAVVNGDASVLPSRAERLHRCSRRHVIEICVGGGSGDGAQTEVVVVVHKKKKKEKKKQTTRSPQPQSRPQHPQTGTISTRAAATNTIRPSLAPSPPVHRRHGHSSSRASAPSPLILRVRVRRQTRDVSASSLSPSPSSPRIRWSALLRRVTTLLSPAWQWMRSRIVHAYYTTAQHRSHSFHAFASRRLQLLSRRLRGRVRDPLRRLRGVSYGSTTTTTTAAVCLAGIAGTALLLTVLCTRHSILSSLLPFSPPPPPPLDSYTSIDGTCPPTWHAFPHARIATAIQPPAFPPFTSTPPPSTHHPSAGFYLVYNKHPANAECVGIPTLDEAWSSFNRSLARARRQIARCWHDDKRSLHDGLSDAHFELAKAVYGWCLEAVEVYGTEAFLDAQQQDAQHRVADSVVEETADAAASAAAVATGEDPFLDRLADLWRRASVRGGHHAASSHDNNGDDSAAARTERMRENYAQKVDLWNKRRALLAAMLSHVAGGEADTFRRNWMAAVWLSRGNIVEQGTNTDEMGRIVYMVSRQFRTLGAVLSSLISSYVPSLSSSSSSSPNGTSSTPHSPQEESVDTPPVPEDCIQYLYIAGLDALLYDPLLNLDGSDAQILINTQGLEHLVFEAGSARSTESGGDDSKGGIRGWGEDALPMFRTGYRSVVIGTREEVINTIRQEVFSGIYREVWEWLVDIARQ